MKLLTNLIFEPKGRHDPALTYSIKDTVMSADGSRVYFALQDVPAGTALTDEDYWKLQIDLSASKSSMDNALADFANYAKEIGTKVRGETAKVNGNPVTFLPDAGSLLQPVSVLEPQQEGSGDPYPAGGGRNLLNNTATTQTINGVTFTVNADGTVTANGTATANAVLRIPCSLTVGETYTLSGCPAGGSTSTYYVQLGYFGNDTGSGVTATATENTGNSVALLVLSGYTASNLVFKPQLELGSTATDFALYSNIRPFIGYDKLDLNQDGKNVLPLPTAAQTINGVTFTPNADGSISCVGTATGEINHALLGGWNSSKALGMLQAYKPYVLSGHTNDVAIRVISGTRTMFDETRLNYTFDKPMPITAVYVAITSGTTVNTKIYPQLEEGSSPTEFAPYSGKLHTIQLSQTVYGGKFDWLTGKLVVDVAFAEYDGSDDENWTVQGTNTTGYRRFSIIPGDVEPNTVASDKAYVLSNMYSTTSPNGTYLRVTGITINQTEIMIYDENRATLTADGWKAWLAENPLQVVYKLATPIEIQLTPHIIPAVEPEQTNTLYGDGSIEVEYVKPLHVSIEERVAAAVQAALATE